MLISSTQYEAAAAAAAGSMISASLEGRLPYMTYPESWRGPPKQPSELIVRPAVKPMPERYLNGTRTGAPEPQLGTISGPTIYRFNGQAVSHQTIASGPNGANTLLRPSATNSCLNSANPTSLSKYPPRSPSALAPPTSVCVTIAPVNLTQQKPQHTIVVPTPSNHQQHHSIVEDSVNCTTTYSNYRLHYPPPPQQSYTPHPQQHPTQFHAYHPVFHPPALPPPLPTTPHNLVNHNNRPLHNNILIATASPPVGSVLVGSIAPHTLACSSPTASNTTTRFGAGTPSKHTILPPKKGAAFMQFIATTTHTTTSSSSSSLQATSLPPPPILPPPLPPPAPHHTAASPSSLTSPNPCSSSSISSSSSSVSSFKVPSGKEGSLKHRILTRPEESTGIMGAASPYSPPKSPLHSNASVITDTTASALARKRLSIRSPPVVPKKLQVIQTSNGTIITSHTSNTARSSPLSNGTLSSRSLHAVSFRRGSLIQLITGEMRKIEDLRTEDFVLSVDANSDVQLAESTVTRITENGVATAIITLSYNQRKAQADMESAIERPFFVFGQGWASCHPERTMALLGLKVHRLQVGDIIISLMPRPRAAVPLHPPPTKRTSGAAAVQRSTVTSSGATAANCTTTAAIASNNGTSTSTTNTVVRTTTIMTTATTTTMTARTDSATTAVAVNVIHNSQQHQQAQTTPPLLPPPPPQPINLKQQLPSAPPPPSTIGLDDGRRRRWSASDANHEVAPPVMTTAMIMPAPPSRSAPPVVATSPHVEPTNNRSVVMMRRTEP